MSESAAEMRAWMKKEKILTFQGDHWDRTIRK